MALSISGREEGGTGTLPGWLDLSDCLSRPRHPAPDDGLTRVLWSPAGKVVTGVGIFIL